MKRGRSSPIIDANSYMTLATADVARSALGFTPCGSRPSITSKLVCGLTISPARHRHRRRCASSTAGSGRSPRPSGGAPHLRSRAHTRRRRRGSPPGPARRGTGRADRRENLDAEAEARHSRNLAVRPQLAIVIFGSSTAKRLEPAKPSTSRRGAVRSPILTSTAASTSTRRPHNAWASQPGAAPTSSCLHASAFTARRPTSTSCSPGPTSDGPLSSGDPEPGRLVTHLSYRAAR